MVDQGNEVLLRILEGDASKSKGVAVSRLVYGLIAFFTFFTFILYSTAKTPNPLVIVYLVVLFALILPIGEKAYTWERKKAVEVKITSREIIFAEPTYHFKIWRGKGQIISREQVSGVEVARSKEGVKNPFMAVPAAGMITALVIYTKDNKVRAIAYRPPTDILQAAKVLHDTWGIVPIDQAQKLPTDQKELYTEHQNVTIEGQDRFVKIVLYVMTIFFLAMMAFVLFTIATRGLSTSRMIVIVMFSFMLVFLVYMFRVSKKQRDAIKAVHIYGNGLLIKFKDKESFYDWYSVEALQTTAMEDVTKATDKRAAIRLKGHRFPHALSFELGQLIQEAYRANVGRDPPTFTAQKNQRKPLFNAPGQYR